MPRLEVDVVTDDRSFARLEEAWATLLAATPGACGFQSYAWISACRAHLGGGRLFTLVVRDRGETIGVLPTEVGSHGDLRLIGDAVTNYAGPVYHGTRLAEVVAAWADFLASNRDGIRLLDFRSLPARSPFLAAWAAAPLPGWADASVVSTARCPYVDLAPGWEALYGSRSGKARGQLARKWRALGRLGRPEFVETTDPNHVRAVLPAMFALFAARWTGRRESGGFAGRHRAFHERAAPALAGAGHVRLTLLELDGRLIAFSYGVLGGEGTVSYVIAHDDALAGHSPGSLLLLRLIQAACERGEREYDFSIGDERYKTEWSTGVRDVFRVLRWRRRSLAAVDGALRELGTRAWVTARSVEWLRDVKREGVRRGLLGRRDEEPDAPGLPAGAGGRWTLYGMPLPPAAARPPAVTSWRYDEMRRHFSPRLLAVAADRSFRNDALLVLRDGERLLGVVWRACPARRSVVTGGHDVAGERVYYDPIAAAGVTLEDLARALASVDGPDGSILVARSGALASLAPVLGAFTADLGFRTAALHRRDRAPDVAAS